MDEDRKHFDSFCLFGWRIEKQKYVESSEINRYRDINVDRNRDKVLKKYVNTLGYNHASLICSEYNEHNNLPYYYYYISLKMVTSKEPLEIDECIELSKNIKEASKLMELLTGEKITDNPKIYNGVSILS
jgi:hypothetical protein